MSSHLKKAGLDTELRSCAQVISQRIRLMQTQAQHAARLSLLPKAALAQKEESKNTDAAGSAWPPLQALTHLSALMDLGYDSAAGRGVFLWFPHG